MKAKTKKELRVPQPNKKQPRLKQKSPPYGGLFCLLVEGYVLRIEP